MALSKTFDRFVQYSPVSVMVRSVLENVYSTESLDELFRTTAKEQVEKDLLFSTVVELLQLVVVGSRKSIHDAYQQAREEVGVSVESIYNKLKGTEPAVSRELVRRPARRLARIVDQMEATLPPLVPGYCTKIVDGNHFPGTDHRIKELRTTRSGALPGQVLAVLEPERMLIADVIPCEDGHAQERSLLPELLKGAQPNDLWIADRNFCTTGFLFGLARASAAFVIRQHGSTLSWRELGPFGPCGRCATGAVAEQPIELTDPDGQTMRFRRVRLSLDAPTRKGEDEVFVITNLPAQKADAAAVAMAYRLRWTIENAFQELSQAFQSEINSLGYPRAALLSFSVAALAYNVISVAKAALRAVHGDEAAPRRLSAYYLAGEISAAYHGMMIAIPPSAWRRQFASLTPAELAATLKRLAQHVRLKQFRKHAATPKKPPPKRTSGKVQKHVSTARLLAQRHSK